MPLAPGARLGPYEVLSAIGAGGMGEIYRAWDTRLGRDVAIKVLPAAFAADPDRVRRLEQEARAVAALNHPHVCQIYDVRLEPDTTSASGPSYLVLEFIDGSPLAGPLASAEAIRLALQMADALDAAHQKGILHRDLKPANVLVTRDGRVKVLDFGLAKVMTPDSDVTRTIDGTVLGTVPYMSPEQAQGRTLDARSDIFSLGAVLYEMLAGAPAFSGPSAADVLTAVLRDNPPPLAAPPALERLVSRCLAKPPAQRFQTMAAVKTALEQLSAPVMNRQPSIAVLPFADMSEAKDQEWFSDGLAEEIINTLAHIPGLKVTARTSAFAFRGKQQDITTIAQALRVQTILEGSIRRAGNRLRVTAQLISADDGYHLWSERYDRDLTDIFAIQDDIARAIARALQITLSWTPGAHRRHTPNIQAYEAYLKGHHHIFKMTDESTQRGRRFFEQAIDLDPDFALAHWGLGSYFFHRVATGVPGDDTWALVRTEARRALDLDPELSEAHVLLGMVACAFYDWPVAEREFQLAMAREPVAPWARDNYSAFYLLQVGRVAEAGGAIERALQEDPLNLIFRIHWGAYLIAAGRDADAVTELLEALDIDPDFPLAHAWISSAYSLQGHWMDAERHMERAYSLSPNALMACALAGTLVRTGDSSRAESLLQTLENGETPVTLTGRALFHVNCGDVEEALAWLEKAIERRESLAMILVLFRRFCSSSPRWPAVARMLNLPG
jgi:serine/threonine protein kinase/tetratricopeptide (TPR) repeat protein